VRRGLAPSDISASPTSMCMGGKPLRSAHDGESSGCLRSALPAYAVPLRLRR
jgi:hypothetical protein